MNCITVCTNYGSGDCSSLATLCLIVIFSDRMLPDNKLTLIDEGWSSLRMQIMFTPYHPNTEIEMEWHAPLPDDMVELIRVLKWTQNSLKDEMDW